MRLTIIFSSLLLVTGVSHAEIPTNPPPDLSLPNLLGASSCEQGKIELYYDQHGSWCVAEEEELFGPYVWTDANGRKATGRSGTKTVYWRPRAST